MDRNLIVRGTFLKSMMLGNELMHLDTDDSARQTSLLTHDQEKTMLAE